MEWVRPIHIIGNERLSLWRNLAINGDIKIRSIIRKNVVHIDIKIDEKTIFLLSFLFSDTILLTDIGSPPWASVINKLNVGIISI